MPVQSKRQPANDGLGASGSIVSTAETKTATILRVLYGGRDPSLVSGRD